MKLPNLAEKAAGKMMTARKTKSMKTKMPMKSKGMMKVDGDCK